jgi:uncharacterized protein YbjT (DUF2867 family)
MCVGKVYPITGPEALTHGEIAAKLSEALGRAVRHVDISPEQMRETVLSFQFRAIREGLRARVPSKIGRRLIRAAQVDDIVRGVHYTANDAL